VRVTCGGVLGHVRNAPRDRGGRRGHGGRGRGGNRGRRPGSEARARLDDVGQGGQRCRAEDDAQDERTHRANEN